MKESIKERIKDTLRPAYYIYLSPKINRRCKETEKEFLEYKDAHKREMCCIVASGASLKIEDLDTLYKNKVLCLSMNKTFTLYDRTLWRPKYYFVQDPKCIRNYYSELTEIAKESTLFIRPTGQKQYDIKKSICYKVDYSKSWKNLNPEFSNGDCMTFFDGKTVAYSVLQCALYMGFSTVYLLGFDCDYGNNNIINKNSYPDPRMYDPQKIGMPPDVEYWFRSYEIAREYAEKHSVSIINLTRGGKLEVFDRKQFDNIFK